MLRYVYNKRLYVFKATLVVMFSLDLYWVYCYIVFSPQSSCLKHFTFWIIYRQNEHTNVPAMSVLKSSGIV